MARIIISRKDKIVWIAVPKVASMSIQSAMLRTIGANWNEYDDHSLRRLKEVSALTDHFRFAFVRNPWSRLVSCWSDRVMGPVRKKKQKFLFDAKRFSAGMPFDEFLRQVAKIPDRMANPHFRSQSALLSYQGELVVDFVGRYEELNDDWYVLSQHYRLAPLAHVNRSPERHAGDVDYHRSFYSEELVDLVGRRYAEDIERFGYDYDPFVPRFLPGPIEAQLAGSD